MNSFEKEPNTISQMAHSQIKIQSLSHHPPNSQISKSPLFRGISSPQSYFSSVSYQRATNISPNFEIQSKLTQQPNQIKPTHAIDQRSQFIVQNEYESYQKPMHTILRNEFSLIKDPIKQIALLKNKIKEEQFLIELQNAVHKELMNILSKKDKSLSSFKHRKLQPDTLYEIQEQTESFLDKAESYAKEIHKLTQMAQKKTS